MMKRHLEYFAINILSGEP